MRGPCRPRPGSAPASSSVHPGIIPHPTTAGTPASRNAPSISRRSSAAIVPSPIVAAAIPPAAHVSSTGFSYSAHGPTALATASIPSRRRASSSGFPTSAIAHRHFGERAFASRFASRMS